MIRALAHSDMNGLLKFLMIAAVLLISVIVLTLCADGLCSACSHECCSGADRSRSFLSSARRMCADFASNMSCALAPFGLASQRTLVARAAVVPTPALLRASSLRI